MSKAVKTVVSVVAAVAIPFAAPAIASSIGLSAAIGSAVGSATAGAVLGGAVTGAVLGGATQAALGGDAGRGALMGAIGGGIGGYSSAPSAATGAAGGAAGGTGLTATTAAPTTASLGGGTGLTAGGGGYGLTAGGGGYGLTAGGGGYGLTAPSSVLGGAGSTATGLGAAMAPVDYSLTAGMQLPTVGLNPATAGIGLQMPDPGFAQAGVANALATGTPIDYSLGAYMPPSTGLQAVMANPVTGGTQVVTGEGVFQSATPISAYSGGTYSPALAAGGTVPIGEPTSFINQPLPPAPVTQATAPSTTGTATTGTATTGAAGTTATAATKPTTFAEALKQVPSAIAARFTDPNALADLTLRAAGMLAGSALAGQGVDQLSPEEQALLQAQTDELRDLRENNIELFNQRLEQAQQLIGESKYFDPEYFGLQRARRAQIAGARAKRAGLRGLTGESRAAAARRFDLATGRDVGTAFDQGFGTGVQGRLQTMQAGLSMMPTTYPSTMDAYGNIRAAYETANQRARQTQADIGSLFGSLTGGAQSRGRG